LQHLRDLLGLRRAVDRTLALLGSLQGLGEALKLIDVNEERRPLLGCLSAQQFMELLFGKLPEFFKDEAELRAIWCAPDTRKKLLQGLAENGFGRDQLAEMQKIIDAEKSDLFDVLAHVAYAMPPLTREERAARAKVVISTHFNTKQQAFLDFVLSHYVSVGVDELDQEKLTPLLRLKYHNSIADAVADLGMPETIGRVFSSFQKFLYQPTVNAAQAFGGEH
jgi:type I restriction enzyme R subunit